MSKFDQFIDRILGLEGGYVNHPDDPGGETNWGISKRSYPQFSIAELTREQAIEIYRLHFWNAVHGDELPPVAAYQALDFAVNSGVQTAIRKMQQALGVADDGHWGQVTQAAAAKVDPAVFVLRFLAARLRFFRSLSTWPKFGRGWAERIAVDMVYAAEDLEAS